MSDALVGLLGGLLGALIGVLGTLAAHAYQHSSDVVQKRLDLRLRQLNDFYGPLYIERRRAEAQRRLLPDDSVNDQGETVRWRLVEHIEEAKQNETYAQAVEVILSAGDEMVKILMKSSGLVAQDRTPESIQKFIDHHDRLRRSWKDGVSQPKERQLPFPGGRASSHGLGRCADGSRAENMDDDIDCAIYLGLRWVQDDITVITNVKDFKGSPFYEAMGPVTP